MSSQLLGPDGQPLFDENYPSNLADDLNEVSNYAASLRFSTRRVALQLNGPRDTGANNGDIQWDTVLSDPAGMRDGDGYSIRALWNGRYAVGCRVALQRNIPVTEVVTVDVCNSADGTIYGSVGMWGLPGDRCALLTDEITLAAGSRIRFRIGWSGTSGARQFTYGNDAVRARIWARYLGPA